MHVVGDFLKRWIAPQQTRARLSCWFTSSNNLGRIHHGPGTDLSWEELELLVKGITSESFIPETLIPPVGIPPLCDDQGASSPSASKVAPTGESGPQQQASTGSGAGDLPLPATAEAPPSGPQVPSATAEAAPSGPQVPAGSEGSSAADVYCKPNGGDVVEYTVGNGGRRGGRVQLHPDAHSGGARGYSWAAAPKVFDREREVTRKEKRLAKKEEHLDQREEVITALQEKLKAYNVMLEKQRDEQTAAVATLQKLQRKLDDRASNIAMAEENLKAKDASLEERATDLAWREKDLAFKEVMWERRDKLLADHELDAEEKEKKLEEKERTQRTLEERVRRFQETQVAQVAQAAQAAPGSQAVEAMKKTLEDLQAEHRTGVQRIAAWADEASSALVPLGVSPIPVLKQSVSISDALPMLDSAADRLRHLDQILGARLEAEGSRLCRADL
eukprot:XP_008653725.1 protein MLP1 homolog [Zea mays]